MGANLHLYALSEAPFWLLPYRTVAWNVLASFLVSSWSLQINSPSSSYPIPPRLLEPSFQNPPQIMSLSYWQHQQVIGLSLFQKRASFWISVPPQLWLWQSKMLSKDSEAIWGRSEVRSEVERPWGRVCPGVQMTSKRNPYLPACWPIQLLSPSTSTESDLSLGFIFYIVGKVIHRLDYRHHVS